MSPDNKFYNAAPDIEPTTSPEISAARLYPDIPKKIYLYATCLIDLLYPQAGLDAISVLEQQGIEVIFVEQQSCCGQPAYTSGYTEQALMVARSQLGLFTEPWPVVVLSGSCGGMMRHHYPQLFAGHSEHQAALNLSERIFELSEFLVHVLKLTLNDQGQPTRVVLHTSCTARREMNTHLSGRALLEQLDNVEIALQDHEAECCGFGGAFSVRHPEISGAMVEDKIESLQKTKAEQLVSADCGCLMNINGALEANNSSLRGMHLASFLRTRSGESL